MYHRVLVWILAQRHSASYGPQNETLDGFGAPLTVPLLGQSRCCRLGDIVTKGRKQRVREFKALKGDAARSRILVDSSGVLHSGEPILAYVHSGVANTTFRPAQNQPQLTPDASGTYCTDELARAVLAAARPPHYALTRRPSKKTINQPDRSQFKLLDNTSGSQFKLLDNTSGSQFKPLIDTSGSQFKLSDNTSGSQFKPLIDASGSQFKLLDNTGGSQTSCKQESVQAARPPGGVCSSRRAPRGVCSSRKASRGSLFKPQGAERSLFKPQGLQEESVQAAGRQEESVQAARVAGAPGGGAKKEEKTTDNGYSTITLSASEIGPPSHDALNAGCVARIPQQYPAAIPTTSRRHGRHFSAATEQNTFYAGDLIGSHKATVTTMVRLLTYQGE
ncbi:hypothetical protein PG987_000169 [Apiospora arundinis]